MLEGWHSCRNIWRVFPDKDSFINVNDVIPFLKTPKLLQFDDIAWKGMDMPLIKYSNRYINADITFPGVVVEDGPNPFDKKYRMIDGGHRMAKMQYYGMTESFFHVINTEQFYSLLRDTTL